MKKNLFFFLLSIPLARSKAHWAFAVFFLPCFSSAQTSIKGSAPSFAGKEIRLYTYKDYITKTKVLIETSPISPEGEFIFNLPANTASSTFTGIFKIENFAGSMYIEPDSEYEISLAKPDSGDFPEDRINYIEINILRPKNELNYYTKNFIEKYNHFVEKNYSLFLRKSAKNEVDSFKIKTLKEYNRVENPFLKNYVNFYLASLDLIATTNRFKVYNDYLARFPVDYKNDSYMNFFNQFYHKQFDSFSEPHTREMLISAVNVQKNYENSIASLSNEKLLENEKIRELVLMKGLYENYSNKDFDKKSIQFVIKELVKKSPYPEHREIAMIILQETEKLGVGAMAPVFSLFDRNQKLVNLSDFKGKYVYLDFWATWCIPCIKEMPAMADLKKKYGKDIIFISISIDNDMKTMQKFLKKKKEYDWVFLHYGSYPELKELYNVMAIPVYYLIDPEGVIIQSPAYRPSGKIEETFINISSGKKTKRKAYEWDW